MAKQWQRPLKMMEDLERRMEAAPREEKEAMQRMSPPSLGDKTGRLDIDDVRRLVANPLQELLVEMINVEMRILPRMNMAFVTTTEDPGFITSDAPCSWVDPGSVQGAGFLPWGLLGVTHGRVNAAHLASRLSAVGWQDLKGYIPVDREVVEKANRSTRFHTHEHFVSRRNHTEDYWFDAGEMPDDAWEKMHPRATDPTEGE